MPMQGGCLIPQPICYPGDDTVTLGSIDDWRWPLIVDTDDRAQGHTIRIRQYPGNIPVEDQRLCFDSPDYTEPTESHQTR